MKLLNKTPEELRVCDKVMLGSSFYDVIGISHIDGEEKYKVLYKKYGREYIIMCKKEDQLTIKG
jgi:hypothetical protein